MGKTHPKPPSTPPPLKKGRGRPPGSKNSATKFKESRQHNLANANALRAQRRAREDEEIRSAAGPPLRKREKVVEEGIPTPPKVGGKVLVQEQIDSILHLVCRLKEAKKEFLWAASLPNEFTLAAGLSGFSETTVRDLWSLWEKKHFGETPRSRQGASRKTRTSALVKKIYQPLRKKVDDLKRAGKNVEVPDLLKFLEKDLSTRLTRPALTHLLRRMGFLYGKTWKFQILSESERVLLLRKEYIENRKKWDAKIEQRNKEIEEWQKNPVGEKPRKLVYVYLDESYVNRNHTLGFTWYHPEDEMGQRVAIPKGKGERLVLLTAITEEYGILEPSTILIFQARKRSGDYHQNMNADCFCEWLEEDLFPALAKKGLEGILVMDNAAYHCTPAPNALNVDSFTTKIDITAVLEKFGIPFKSGRANKNGTGGDNLPTLKDRLRTWLGQHAAEHNIVVNKTRVQQLCEKYKHPHPLMTPPYCPQFQPIEELWRDVKMFVARHFAGTRKMKQLHAQVLAGFKKYGTAAHTKNKVTRAREAERNEETMLPSLLAKARDLAEKERQRLATVGAQPDESDSEIEVYEVDSGSESEMEEDC